MTTEETEQLNSYNKRSAESAKLYYEEVNHKIDLERELLTLTEKLIQELDLSPAERKRFHKVNDLFNNEKKKEQERRESLP
jgi:Tfp pilus assembly protein PilF